MFDMKTVMVKDIEAAHKTSGGAGSMDQHEELEEAGGSAFIQEEVCPPTPSRRTHWVVLACLTLVVLWLHALVEPTGGEEEASGRGCQRQA